MGSGVNGTTETAIFTRLVKHVFRWPWWCVLFRRSTRALKRHRTRASFRDCPATLPICLQGSPKGSAFGRPARHDTLRNPVGMKTRESLEIPRDVWCLSANVHGDCCFFTTLLSGTRIPANRPATSSLRHRWKLLRIFIGSLYSCERSGDCSACCFFSFATCSRTSGRK